MTRKIVCHSILAALVLIAVCSAVPSPLISADNLSSTVDLIGTGSYPADFLSSSDGAFGSDLGLGEFDLGLSVSIDSIPSTAVMQDFANRTSVLLSEDVAGEGGDLYSPVPPTQVVPSERVHLASETAITPTTGVFPNLIFQPAVQLYGPVINNFQAYGADSAYTNGFAASSGLGVASFKKRQLAGGLMSPLGPGSLVGSSAGGAFGHIPIAGSGFGGPIGSPPVIVNGAPTDVATDTLIQPIVNIQPHALQPVPVPVSAPYDYPVPVGVSVPVGPIGGWGSSDSGWGEWGSGWHGGGDCDGNCDGNRWGNDWWGDGWGSGWKGGWGSGWKGGWGNDCDWDWSNDCNW
ncbi:hypothetical protein EC991_007532 [Linnemannia zychae]|nr:hypothetical protein EC991_007532 [Linnemannia zychae]